MQVTAISYGQFLINSHLNFTGTYMAETVAGLKHDSVYRYLKAEQLTPATVWEKTKDIIVYSPNGHVIFDDTVLDKNHSQKIEAARSQYSGNAHHVVTGIGVVNCLYYNPEADEFWVVDYRIFDPASDGKTKLDHVADMLHQLTVRQIPYATVLMDTWYATTETMLRVHSLKKTFYCPLKSNRLVDDNDSKVHRQVDQLTWTEAQLAHGKLVHVKKFPKNFILKLFRLTVSTDRTEYVVTNNLTQNSQADTQQASALRWKIEQFHREEKQVTGIEKCQARLNRSQRNHICLAMLAWIVLKQAAKQRGVSIYQQKREPLLKFMATQWRNPATVFA